MGFFLVNALQYWENFNVYIWKFNSVYGGMTLNLNKTICAPRTGCVVRNASLVTSYGMLLGGHLERWRQPYYFYYISMVFSNEVLWDLSSNRKKLKITSSCFIKFQMFEHIINFPLNKETEIKLRIESHLYFLNCSENSNLDHFHFSIVWEFWA